MSDGICGRGELCEAENLCLGRSWGGRVRERERAAAMAHCSFCREFAARERICDWREYTANTGVRGGRAISIQKG